MPHWAAYATGCPARSPTPHSIPGSTPPQRSPCSASRSSKYASRYAPARGRPTARARSTASQPVSGSPVADSASGTGAGRAGPVTVRAASHRPSVPRSSSGPTTASTWPAAHCPSAVYA